MLLQDFNAFSPHIALASTRSAHPPKKKSSSLFSLNDQSSPRHSHRRRRCLVRPVPWTPAARHDAERSSRHFAANPARSPLARRPLCCQWTRRPAGANFLCVRLASDSVIGFASQGTVFFFFARPSDDGGLLAFWLFMPCLASSASMSLSVPDSGVRSGSGWLGWYAGTIRELRVVTTAYCRVHSG